MNTYAGFSPLPPSSHATEYATGSNDATMTDAMNMRRGVLGAIIAKIRISRQIHEIRMMSLPAGGTAQALKAAIPAPCISIIATPALLLLSMLVLALRTCQYITAEPVTPHS